MKTPAFVLLMIGCVPLMRGADHTAIGDPADQDASSHDAVAGSENHPTDAESRISGLSGGNSGRNSLRSHHNLAARTIPVLRKNGAHSGAAGATNVPHTGFDRDRNTKQAGSIRSATIHPNPAGTSMVRHLTSNPAVISGIANSKNANSSAIDGTRMERRR